MFQYLLRLLPVFTLLLILPARTPAQEPAPAAAAAEAELREATRKYDDALRRADVAGVERYWATEYTFVNPRGERVTRADRLANLRSGRTAFDSIAHAPQEEEILTYGDGEVAVYTTLLTVGGRYGGQGKRGQGERGQFRALVVWVRGDGRWQQVASQLTPVLAQ